MRHTNKTTTPQTINTSSNVLRAQAGALSMDSLYRGWLFSWTIP